MTLRELVDDDLDVAMRVAGIARVARLPPDELRWRIDEIYRTRYGELVRHARDRLDNDQQAEDVVQESFDRVLRANPDLEAPEALGGYVWQTVRNETSRLRHKLGRDRDMQVREKPADLERILTDPAKPLVDRLCDRLTLVVAIALLADRQRQVLVLRYLLDLSVNDAATALGVSDGTVKSTLSDALSRLHAALSEPPLRLAPR